MLAKLIKELRQRTGSGFLDCKNALEESNMNVDKAIEWLQAKGVAKAAKKAIENANEGIVSIVNKENVFVMYEINSQTDFVAQNFEFKTLVKKIGDKLICENFNSVKEAHTIMINNKQTIKDIIIEAIAKLGEKIELRRVIKIIKQEGESIGTYIHTNNKIATIFLTKGGDNETARKVSMHIASMNPEFLEKTSINSEKIIKIKKAISESEELKNKPENIKVNIAAGMLKKQLSKLTLLDQEFVMEKMLVSEYLEKKNAIAKKMWRFEVGEKIE